MLIAYLFTIIVAVTSSLFTGLSNVSGASRGISFFERNRIFVIFFVWKSCTFLSLWGKVFGVTGDSCVGKQALINFKRETGVPAFPHFCSNFTPK